MTLAVDPDEALLIKKLLIAEEKRRRLNEPRSDWRNIARPKQLPPPGEWSIWLLLCGRAFGKTRTGGEAIAELMTNHPGSLWGVIGPKWSHTRDVPIAEIRSSLKRAGWAEGKTVATNQYAYNKSDLTVELPNGAVAKGFSAETPDALRGFNLWGAWCDEICFYPRLTELWYEALVPAVRIGAHPHIIITTTPKPKKLLKDLTTRDDGSVAVTVGTMYENEANLSPLAVAELRRQYDGTRRGRQELYGELIWEAEGALWNSELIEAVQWLHPLPKLIATIVSVDPSGSATGDATGIMTMSLGQDRVIYVQEDDTCKGAPGHRYEQVCFAAHKSGAGVIVYEGTYGGDNIAHGIESTWEALKNAGRLPAAAMLPRLVASPTPSSKADRAHPVVALYEQTAAYETRKLGKPRIRHVGSLPKLEEEQVQWEPGSSADQDDEGSKSPRGSKWSPNRIDALVHGARYLSETYGGEAVISTHHRAPALPKLPIR